MKQPTKQRQMIHKNWKIEKVDYGYFEATNLIDCDASTKVSKSIEQLKEAINEEA